MKKFKTFLLAVIVIIFVVFAVQNFEMFTGGLLWSNLKKLAKHDEEGAKKQIENNG